MYTVSVYLKSNFCAVKLKKNINFNRISSHKVNLIFFFIFVLEDDTDLKKKKKNCIFDA